MLYEVITSGKQWRNRLDHLLRHANEEDARRFMQQNALPALQAICAELMARGMDRITSYNVCYTKLLRIFRRW